MNIKTLFFYGALATSLMACNNEKSATSSVASVKSTAAISSVTTSSAVAISSAASSSVASLPHSLVVTSTSFVENATLAAKYSCDGIDVNPQLQWEGVPEGTKSFAIIVDDPDALAGFGLIWVHWNVYNIPATVNAIAEAASNTAGAMPLDSVQGSSDFGKAIYGGPCPPSGRHKYHFAVYALNTATISMVTPSTRGEFEAAHASEILDQASIHAYFR